MKEVLHDSTTEGQRSSASECTKRCFIDRLKNISQVLNDCISEDKKPRIGQDGKLTSVDLKKHTIIPEVGQKGQSKQTSKAIGYIASQIQKAIDLNVNTFTIKEGETVKTVNLIDLINSYEELGGKRQWTVTHKNFLPAISAIRDNLNPPVVEAPADSTKAPNNIRELVDEISKGNHRELSGMLISSQATGPLFLHIEETFLEIMVDGRSLLLRSGNFA